MSPIEQFEMLLAMAAADKRMNEAELGFLSERAHQLGLTQGEFHDAIERAVQGLGIITIPESNGARRALLKDLVLMMAADGVLDDREKELFAHIASVMDISNEEVHQIVDATIADQSQ